MATTEGVVRAPSWLGITTGSPPCMTATTELVVPKSIPIILLIWFLSCFKPKICYANRPSAELQTGSSDAGFRDAQFDAGGSIKVECIFVKILEALYKAIIVNE